MDNNELEQSEAYKSCKSAEDWYLDQLEISPEYPHDIMNEDTLPEQPRIFIEVKLDWTTEGVLLILNGHYLDRNEINLMMSECDKCLTFYEKTDGSMDALNESLHRNAVTDDLEKLGVPSGKHKSSGYVYLIQSSTGFYKIGRTASPKDRIKTFSVKLPFEVEYVHLIPCNDMISSEKQLHSYFSMQRINGEWFDLSPKDVELIKSIKAM